MRWLLWGRSQKGISLIEVLTAIAILAVGIWALVTLFPRGQEIIRKVGFRQRVTQILEEAMGDFLTDPQKLPFGVVPYDPKALPTRALLLEPASLLLVRQTYNFIWGEPLEFRPFDTDGDNIPDEWRTPLRFAPVQGLGQINIGLRGRDAPLPRLYRLVFYRKVEAQSLDPPGTPGDYTFAFDPTQNRTVFLPVNGSYPRLLRVTYRLLSPMTPVSIVFRELYLAETPQLTLREPAAAVLEVIEEFPLPVPPSTLSLDRGVLFVPRRDAVDPLLPPGLSPLSPRLGPIRVDYFLDNRVGEGGGRGPWLIETGILTPSLQGPTFKTLFGGVERDRVHAVIIDRIRWGDPISPDPHRSDFQAGLLRFPTVSVGTFVRVAYHTTQDWWLQLINPSQDFQLAPSQNPDPPPGFPFERLRWFSFPDASGTPHLIRFHPFLAGLSVFVEWRSSKGIVFQETQPIANDGTVVLSGRPVEIISVKGAALMGRISGQLLWQEFPPRRRGEYVEILTLIPPVSP